MDGMTLREDILLSARGIACTYTILSYDLRSTESRGKGRSGTGVDDLKTESRNKTNL